MGEKRGGVREKGAGGGGAGEGDYIQLKRRKGKRNHTKSGRSGN